MTCFWPHRFSYCSCTSLILGSVPSSSQSMLSRTWLDSGPGFFLKGLAFARRSTVVSPSACWFVWDVSPFSLYCRTLRGTNLPGHGCGRYALVRIDLGIIYFIKFSSCFLHVWDCITPSSGATFVICTPSFVYVNLMYSSRRALLKIIIIGLSPGGSGYLTLIQNMSLVCY